MNNIIELLDNYNIIGRKIEETDKKLVIFIEDINLEINRFIIVQIVLEIEFNCSEKLGKFIEVVMESKVDNPEDYKNYPIIQLSNYPIIQLSNY